MMRYLSLCSGIEAATVAWRPLGWRAAAFSEIEPFPCAVLDHHYPEVPNLGDIRMVIHRGKWLGKIDVLVGGTPCQSFSVAGLRRGLEDDRGNLSLEFVRIADDAKPDFIIWENVPGIFSDRGNAFGCFLGGLAGEVSPLEPPGSEWADAGYVLGPSRAIAWRILDAQYFCLAQRRRRVFIVACPRNGADPRKILFEFNGLRRDSAPGRETGAEIAGTSTRGAYSRGSGGCPESAAAGYFRVTQALTGRLGDGGPDDNKAQGGFYVPSRVPAVSCKWRKGTGGPSGDECQNLVAHTLRGDGFDASVDGTERGTPLAPVAFDCKAGGKTSFSVGDVPGSLRGEGHGGGHLAVALNIRGRDGGATAELSGEVATALRSSQGGGDKPYCLQNVGVRRLTPCECERLQGFPDNYTLIPYRGKPAADGPRYKALGNSMAVPVMRWIGERIERVKKR